MGSRIVKYACSHHRSDRSRRAVPTVAAPPAARLVTVPAPVFRKEGTRPAATVPGLTGQVARTNGHPNGSPWMTQAPASNFHNGHNGRPVVPPPSVEAPSPAAVPVDGTHDALAREISRLRAALETTVRGSIEGVVATKIESLRESLIAITQNSLAANALRPALSVSPPPLPSAPRISLDDIPAMLDMLEEERFEQARP